MLADRQAEDSALGQLEAVAANIRLRVNALFSEGESKSRAYMAVLGEMVIFSTSLNLRHSFGSIAGWASVART